MNVTKNHSSNVHSAHSVVSVEATSMLTLLAGIVHLVREQSRGGQFACKDCSRSYKRPESLARHKRNECGKAPRYQCPICPFKTKHNFNLKAHIGIKHYQV